MTLFSGSDYIRDVRIGGKQAVAVYLGSQRIWPPMDPEPMQYTTAGAYTYTIPSEADTIDIVLLGGGAAGTNGGFGNGSGGKAGSWTTVTLQRGVDIPWTTTQITGTVGSGGAPNNNPGTSTTATATGMTTRTAAGGTGNMGTTIPNGESPGSRTYNGRTYVGGAQQDFLNNPGNAPGGGGAGGGFGSTAGSGARGQVWFYAYSSAPAPFAATPPTGALIDDFDRANSASLGSSWTARNGTMGITSNAATGSGSGYNQMTYNTPAPSNDMTSTITIGTGAQQLVVMGANAAGTEFVFALNVTSAVYLFVGGSWNLAVNTQVAADTVSFAQGDAMGLTRVGNVYTVLKNGIPTSVTWTDSSNTVPRDSNHRLVGFAIYSNAGTVEAWSAE